MPGYVMIMLVWVLVEQLARRWRAPADLVDDGVYTLDASDELRRHSKVA